MTVPEFVLKGQGDLFGSKVIRIPEAAQYQHIAISGAIGSGKTRYAFLPILQQAIARGDGLLVVDSRNDLTEIVSRLASTARREKDVVVVGVKGFNYNPFAVHMSPVVLAEVFVEAFQKSVDEYFSPTQRRVLSEFFATLLSHLPPHGRRPSTLLDHVQSSEVGNSGHHVVFSVFSQSLQQLAEVEAELCDAVRNVNSSRDLQRNEFASSQLDFRGFGDVIKNNKIVILNFPLYLWGSTARVYCVFTERATLHERIDCTLLGTPRLIPHTVIQFALGDGRESYFWSDIFEKRGKGLSVFERVFRRKYSSRVTIDDLLKLKTGEFVVFSRDDKSQIRLARMRGVPFSYA